MSIMRKDTVVWTEIPVADMERAKAFYAGLLGAPLVDETPAPNPIAMLPRDSEDVVAGHLYPGKPAARGTGPTVHLAVSVPLAGLAVALSVGLALPLGLLAVQHRGGRTDRLVAHG
mgnify:CR=1 FL=1